MTDNRTIELLPCPFCGGEAQVMHMDLDSIEEGWKVWGVWCVDDLNAEDYRSHGHFIYNYATEAEAIAAGNARAERGTLTADDIRGLIERHSDESGGNGRDFHNGAYVAIADELNGREERTCEVRHMSAIEQTINLVDMITWGVCEDCLGLAIPGMNYCPNCGAKVVDA